jgi:hypothetical protein
MPDNPMKGSYFFDRLPDGSIQMKDLRSLDEQIAGIELDDSEKVRRLCTHIVQLEDIVQQITADNNQIIRNLQDKLAEAEPYAFFYKEMQKVILDNPAVMNEWQQFCLLLKMADPDLNRYNAD